MDRVSFEAAIEADPYDRATRLVYADWLEEHGFDDLALKQREWTKEWEKAKEYLIAFADEVKMSLEAVVEKLKEGRTGYICWTGGQTVVEEGGFEHEMYGSDQEDIARYRGAKLFEMLSVYLKEDYRFNVSHGCSC